MEISEGGGWCECRMPRKHTVGMGFGVSIKGLRVENVTQTNRCARGNNFKHFAPL